MMHITPKTIAYSALLFSFLTTKLYGESSLDSLRWLEDSKSENVKAWIKSENIRTIDRIGSGPKYESLYNQTMKILTLPQSLNQGDEINSFVYEVFKSPGSKEGVWRRTTWSSEVFKKATWETLFDVDLLNKVEKTEYSFAGSNCAAPKLDRCLVTFSKKDTFSTSVREFDISTKTFVKDGFNIPFSKSRAQWVDRDTVLLFDSIADANQTDYGNPRVVKLWKRGGKIEDAPVIFEVIKSDRGIVSEKIVSDRPSNVFLIKRISKSEKREEFLFFDGKFTRFILPSKVRLIGFSNGKAIVSLDEDAHGFNAGTIAAYPFTTQMGLELSPEKIWEPRNVDLVSDMLLIKNNLYLNVIKDVKNKIIRIDLTKPNSNLVLDFPSNGNFVMKRTVEDSEVLKILFENSLTPTTIYTFNPTDNKITKIPFLPTTFDASNMEIKQKFVKSVDGARVPYFVIAKKGLKLNSKNPTIIAGYGGFNRVMVPLYMKLSGAQWLEKGGVFIFANIRGGGELGKSWHEAGMREKKQNVFADIAAVAKDVIARKISSPRHLGLTGASNGGLVAAAVYNQHPELFNAIVCEASVLDMELFPEMGGITWREEYGDPAKPKDLAILMKYSPLHNVKKIKNPPEILLLSSTDDPITNPAHSRKMAERLKSFGLPYLLYESNTGGHLYGTTDFVAKSQSIKMNFFWEKLNLN